MGLEQIGVGNLEEALGHARATLIGHVAAGASATEIPLGDLNLGGANLAGNLVLLARGALGPGSAPALTTITSNTADTLTVPQLAAAPLADAAVWIFAVATIEANVAQNIAEVGGTAVAASVAAGNEPAVPTVASRLAPYLTATTGTIPGTNTQATLEIPLGDIAGPSDTIFDAKMVTIAISNNATAQTIEAASLTFSDSANGAAVSTTPLDFGSVLGNIVSGATAAVLVACANGVLKNASLSVTFGAAPVGGRVDAIAAFHSSADSVVRDGVTGVRTQSLTGSPTLADGIVGRTLSGTFVDAFLHAFNPVTLQSDLVRIDPNTGGLKATPPISAATVMQAAAAAVGQGVGLAVAGYGVAVVDLQITDVATVTWKGVGPGGNTYDLLANQVGGSAAPPSALVSSTTSASGLYRINCAGATTVYAAITAYTSGSVTATGQAQALAAGNQSDFGAAVAPKSTQITGLTRSLLIGGLAPGGYQEPLSMDYAPGATDAIGAADYFGLPTTAGRQGFNGTTWDRVRVADGAQYSFNGTPAATETLVSPGAGNLFRLLGYQLSADTAGQYTLQDGAGAIIGGGWLSANTPMAVTLADNGILSAAAANDLVLNSSVVTGHVTCVVQCAVGASA